MNWGKKILFFYLAFVVGIAFLVVKSMSQQQDLVTVDYYKQELKFQDKIDQSSRTRQLSDSLRLKYENDTLMINFPGDFKNKIIKGQVHIYCPNDEKLDKIQQFSIGNEKLSATVAYAFHGMRSVKIEWEAEGVSYYYEQKLFF